MSPTPNYSAYRLWFDVAQTLMIAAIGVYGWYSNRATVNNKRFVQLEQDVAKKVSDHELRALFAKRAEDCNKHQEQTQALELTTQRLGSELRAIPNRKEIQDLSHSVATLSAKIANLDGKFAGVDRLTSLVNEFLINQGAKNR